MVDMEKFKYDLAMNAALAQVILDIVKKNKNGLPMALMPRYFTSAYEYYCQDSQLKEVQAALKVVNKSE